MKKLLHAFAMCQSMFCVLPCPGRIWDEEARDKMLLFLPVVGLEIGAIWYVLARLCDAFQLPKLVGGVLIAACPYLLTGFMHLDGFMDVTDAVKSWRDLERRREILKDSHVGSFSVISVALLLLAQFACAASVEAGTEVLILVPVLSRCGSALAVTVLPPMSTSQYAGQRKPVSHVVILAALACAVIGAGFVFCGKYAVALLACGAGYGWGLTRAYKSLEGMNGDVAGYALSIGEFCALAALALI